MELWVYILRCADGSYYIGSTKQTVEARVWEHNHGILKGYTSRRLPVELVYAENYERITEGFDRERQLKGWSRAKKEALIRGDLAELESLSHNRVPRPRGSTGSP
jgi:predicted GIY-YIG superfamily endonuclease